jgi:cell division protein FtsB
VKRPISSALKAGWICFGIGLAISWFFPFGHAFFSVALITAVVAMCTHQVNRGLALLISSFVASGVSALIFFTLVLGTIGMAAAPAIRQADSELRKMQAAQTAALNQITQTTTQLQSNLSTIAAQPALPSLSNAPPAPFARSATFDQYRQHDLAMAQQRQVDAQKAADQRKRDQNVWEAERQRDRINAKEQHLKYLQDGIDRNDRLIRWMNEHNVDPRMYQDRRDSLLKEKAKLQGY